MAKRVFVDQNECISCGMCAGNLPAVFRMSDNGKAEAYDPDGASEDEIQNEAVDVCPVACIHWS